MKVFVLFKQQQNLTINLVRSIYILAENLIILNILLINIFIFIRNRRDIGITSYIFTAQHSVKNLNRSIFVSKYAK